MDIAALFKKGYRTTPLYLILPELLYLPLEQLEVTLPDEKVLAKVKATRKRKVSTAVGTSAKSSYRKRHARRSYRTDSGFGASMIFCACWSGRAPRTAISDRAPEQLEVTLSGEKVLAKVEATRKRKASRGSSESRSLDDDDLEMNDRGEKNEDQVLNVIPLRSVGVAKGGNVGGQAMLPLQEIHTGFDPRGSGADDLGNQVADDAPMNRNDYEIDGGNDHSHDGGHPSTITALSIEKIFPSFFLFIFISIFSLTPYNEVDVENHKEPEQASSVPNDTSDHIEREIVSPAPSPYYISYPFEEGKHSNAAMYLGRSSRSIMIQGRKKFVRCQEKTIGKLTTEAQSELEIMTLEVKDLKKSLAERESELLGLKDEVANVRLAEALAQVPSNSNPFFPKVSKHVKYPLKLWNLRNYPLLHLLRFWSQLLQRFRVMSSDITKMISGIEESHHGPSDALYNRS
ncbi:hypothetical protein Tco_0659351 [Tanacetum coccineum]